MKRLLPWKLLIAVILTSGLISTPVTYRGGAAEPHPHMFLQLWIDAASGSFTHDGHAGMDPESGNHARMEEPVEDYLSLEDLQGPVASAFVVSDWGVQALAAPQEMSRPIAIARIDQVTERGEWPAGQTEPPDIPPPRS